MSSPEQYGKKWTPARSRRAHLGKGNLSTQVRERFVRELVALGKTPKKKYWPEGVTSVEQLTPAKTSLALGANSFTPKTIVVKRAAE